MCCGVTCAFFGVAAYFTTAVLAQHLLAANGSSTSEPSGLWSLSSGGDAAATGASGALGAAPSMSLLLALPVGGNMLPEAVQLIGGGVVLLEHCLLLALGVWWAVSTAAGFANRRGKRRQSVDADGEAAADAERDPRALLARARRLCGRVVALAGDASVLSWADVRAAPPPTLDVDALRDGEAASHADERGAIYRFKIGGGALVNMYFTRAGHMRSGDLHESAQYDVVLSGRARLTVMDPETGEELAAEYGPNDFVVIPPRWPHVFEFLEDCALLEWWGGAFAAWYYDPMRRRIEARTAELQAAGAGGGHGGGGGGGGSPEHSARVRRLEAVAAGAHA